MRKRIANRKFHEASLAAELAQKAAVRAAKAAQRLEAATPSVMKKPAAKSFSTAASSNQKSPSQGSPSKGRGNSR